MPVQRFNTGPVDRPSGLVEPGVPLSGVTELRVHGVGGATPEDLLGDLAPQQVSGDRIAGFYRTADLPRTCQRRRRHVEAYSWGGLTSRSGSRALWVLLFPFALANMAGWMCSQWTHRWPQWFRWHRAAVRWAALGLTVNLVLFTAMTSMDLIAYQCGGQPACAGNTWALRLLRASPLAEFPARRILLGALLPLAAIAILALLTGRSIGRYERVRPPFRGQREPDQLSSSAASANVGLTEPTFWDGQRSAANLGVAHLAAGLAFVALAMVHTVQTTLHAAGTDSANPWNTRQVAWLAAGLAIAAALVCAARNSFGKLWFWLLPLLALVGCVAAAGFAWAQPLVPGPQAVGPLPGMRNTINVAFVGILAPVVLVLVVSVLALIASARHDRRADPRPKEATFRWVGPLAALIVAVLALNAVMLGVMIRLADWLGEVSTATPSGAPKTPTLYLFPVVSDLTSYLTIGPLAFVVLVAAIEGTTWWVAGRRQAARDIRRHYQDREAFPRPDTETAWQYTAAPATNAAAGAEPSAERVVKRWAGRVARARRAARIPRETDLVLSAAAAVALVLLGWVQFRVWVQHEEPWNEPWMITAGSWIAAWLPVVLIVLLRRGWRDLSARRRIGILWDVLTFWPRAYHPLAPPSYAERAVPELRRRLWRVYDSDGSIVMVAHSQGTVLAAAALLQQLAPPSPQPGQWSDVAVSDETTPKKGSAPQAAAQQAALLNRVALVTFGSPLRTLYSWAFPAYFNSTVLSRLRPATASGTGIRAWRNLYYQTDYIGREIGTAAADQELPDPITCWYVYGQPEPAPGRHSGYWTDPKVWVNVDEVAEQLVDAAAPVDDCDTATPAPDTALPAIPAPVKERHPRETPRS
ncbi:hypothetical protein [Blastococcus mobilis]|uniref:Integral membrane protein n=1 Tax=Blastococcus mobilis TaxID=1938746 RepID=A0A238ZR22_9ACTN|nr:hypothetical protein [Blastococcus mobilis]SNR85501.1 hypothetical protein SAMN06272737_13147 [Blastococcus mobilis]